MVTIEHPPPQPIEEDEPAGLPLPSNITNGMHDSLPQPRTSNAR